MKNELKLKFTPNIDMVGVPYDSTSLQSSPKLENPPDQKGKMKFEISKNSPAT